MYPREFFDTYWRGNLRNEVFVIMSFDEQFDAVWQSSIKPAIEKDMIGQPLAHRVDATFLAGSVVTEMLDGIAHARLIFADISVCRNQPWQGQRNGNVMYELGIAHTLRLPQETVVVRSDSERINFDIAGIKVQSYDDEDLEAARSQFAQLLGDCLIQIDQSKGLKVTQAIESLDGDTLDVMSTCCTTNPFHVLRAKTMGEAMREMSTGMKPAIRHLLALGIIRSTPSSNPKRCEYYWTEFGKVVLGKLEFR